MAQKLSAPRGLDHLNILLWSLMQLSFAAVVISELMAGTLGAGTPAILVPMAILPQSSLEIRFISGNLREKSMEGPVLPQLDIERD